MRLVNFSLLARLRWYPNIVQSSQVLSDNTRHYLSKMSVDKRPAVFFVLGAPGAGKGTQCSNIVQEFKFVHLSAGDLLRAERNTEGSPYGSLIEQHIRNGTIVPVQITCSLIDRAMRNHVENLFLIDGFPRNQDNLDGWDKEMSDNVDILGVLFFECSEQVCTERCLKRGAAGSGRSDDNEESLKKRFKTYENDTMPIVKYFEAKNLVFNINADRSPESVFEDVKVVIKKVVPSLAQ